MKKYSLILILIISNILFVNNVKGYTCVYEATISPDSSFDGNNNISVTLNIDVNNNLIEPYKIIGIEFASTFIDSLISSEWTDEKLIKEMNGGCFENIYLCELTQLETPGGSSTSINSAIINPDLYNYLYKLPGTGGFRSVFMNNKIFTFNEQSDCAIAKLDEDKSSGSSVTQNIPCSGYDNLWKKIADSYCDISTDDSCSASKMSVYNEEKGKIINYCVNILSYADYINPCVTSCLGLSDDLSLLEGKDNNLVECGFSERLLVWVNNIIRWIKYILPVIVIVLGILDFIKAIGADKDDEMKKAQKKFIIRLIAAALVFIIPLIIEFILNKMGFGYNSCGLF